MKKRRSVSVQQFFEKEAKELGLELVAGEAGLKRVIREPTINRPGLALAGFTKHFASKRVQIIGNAEYYFLQDQSPSVRRARYSKFFSFAIPCLVHSRNHEPDPMLLEIAEKANVPVFRSPLITMKFINQATLALDAMFAPKGSEIGSMVDILGIGVLIRGESGIGKSECVLALLERGYSLVSDDLTRVRVLDGVNVMGNGDGVTRNHMEVRGIGIIDVGMMFGIKSVRPEKKIDLVVTLQEWDKVKNVNRLGMDDEFYKILGLNIPHVIIPVRPGRDLARLVEVAAFQTKLKLSGYNPAEALNQRLIAKMAAGESP